MVQTTRKCVAHPADGERCCLIVAFGRQARCDPCGILWIYDALWRKTMVASRCFKMFQELILFPLMPWMRTDFTGFSGGLNPTGYTMLYISRDHAAPLLIASCAKRAWRWDATIPRLCPYCCSKCRNCLCNAITLKPYFEWYMITSPKFTNVWMCWNCWKPPA